MNKPHHSSSEFGTRQSAPTGQTYVKGDRVRVRKTGETGTVTYAIDSPRGHFVTVRMDGSDRRNLRYLAGNISRIETLF